MMPLFGSSDAFEDVAVTNKLPAPVSTSLTVNVIGPLATP